ncbi:hypothetical protein QTP88_028388 [Uroleucon formosanum]
MPHQLSYCVDKNKPLGSTHNAKRKKMTEAVVSEEDTFCLFINNGDDLLNLKRVVSKKKEKFSHEQKLNNSVETNGSELNENHNKTVSINFDVDNTSLSELSEEMDSYADGNITDGSICTQEDRESKTINIYDENSNETDVNNGENDIQVNSIKCLDVPYSLSNSLSDNDSHDLEDDNSELNNIRSPTSYFNISARAPLCSYKGLDTTFENDNFLLTKEELSNERKRKFKDSAEEDQKSTKIFKLRNLMKYPFQNKTDGTLISEDKSNTFMAEIIVKEENTIEPEPAVCKNNSDNAKTKEKSTQTNFEAAEEIEDTSTNVNKRKFCNIM